MKGCLSRSHHLQPVLSMLASHPYCCTECTSLAYCAAGFARPAKQRARETNCLRRKCSECFARSTSPLCCGNECSSLLCNWRKARWLPDSILQDRPITAQSVYCKVYQLLHSQCTEMSTSNCTVYRKIDQLLHRQCIARSTSYCTVSVLQGRPVIALWVYGKIDQLLQSV